MAQYFLKIPDRSPFFIFGRLEIIFVLQNKSHDEIHDDRRTESEKGKVNEIHPDLSCADAEFFSPPLTNAKSLVFEPRDHISNRIWHGRFLCTKIWNYF